MGLFFFSLSEMSTAAVGANIIIVGKPGSGKSTICKKLSSNEGVRNIDFGEYLRGIAEDSSTLLGRYIATFWSRNNLKEIGFEYFDNEFKKCVSDGLKFVLSSPKVLDDAKEIDIHLKDHNLQIDAVIELSAPNEVCVQRKQDSKDQDESDSTSYSIEDRIENYEKNIEEIKEYYGQQSHVSFLTIDSTQEIDAVVKDIIDQVGKLEKKKADYSHVPEKEQEQEGEESSNEFFERIGGCKRAELMQLMLELAANPKPKIPMTHAVPLFGGNIKELGNRQYVIIRKLNGIRRMIIIYENTLYAISAQYNVFKCTIPLPPSCNWNNSLFDADLVLPPNGEKGVLIFLFDCLCACGTPVRNEKLTGRLNFVKGFAEAVKDVDHPVKVYSQTYYSLSQFPLLSQLGRNGDPTHVVPSARCIADGLMFIPTTLRYNIGCSRYLLTWKPLFLNTIDFAVFKETNDEGKSHFVLKSYLHKEGVYVAYATIDPIPEGYEDLEDTTVVECSLRDDKWAIFKVRKDRNYPNADWVVQDAIEHSKQPISQQQLLQAVKSVIMKGKNKSKR